MNSSSEPSRPETVEPASRANVQEALSFQVLEFEPDLQRVRSTRDPVLVDKRKKAFPVFPELEPLARPNFPGLCGLGFSSLFFFFFFFTFIGGVSPKKIFSLKVKYQMMRIVPCIVTNVNAGVRRLSVIHRTQAEFAWPFGRNSL